MQLSRRDMLKMGLFGSAALMLPAERIARTQLAIADRIPQSQLPQPFTTPWYTPPVLQPVAQSATTDYYAISQKATTAQIIPGLHTDIWGYNGITPGPTVVATQGREVVMRHINDLPAVHPTLRYNVWTSTHLHGSCSLPQYDGYASDVTRPGQFKDYRYPNIQDARTLWYHDHGVHITAQNAYMGLAAQYILHDQTELSLPIPKAEYDFPLIIKDAMFAQNGSLVWDDNSESGIYGDVILVNGRPWPLMEVQPRKYRFRVLNASVSRSYELSLSTNEPFVVIGTDGGLMPHPVETGSLLIAPAERYEVVIDFAKYKPGTQIVMQNTSPKNNRDHDTTNVVMAFKVAEHVVDWRNNEVPMDLNPNMNVMGLQEKDAVRTRQLRFDRSGSNWTINGTTWEDVVNSDYNLVAANPGVNDVEIWEFHNHSGGWFHPVHVHLVDFKILDRNGHPPRDYEKGAKDVVYVGENEVVRVLIKFEHHEGKYMIHCHNLVHEDHDMMTQFQVGNTPRETDYNDPINGDPCKDLKDMKDLYTPPKEDHRGRGRDDDPPVSVSVPTDVTPAAPPAPAPAPAAAPAPAPKPAVRVLGSKRKAKVKLKPRRKVKVKAKSKLKSKVKRKIKTKAKPKLKSKSKIKSKAKRRTVKTRKRSSRSRRTAKR